MDRNTFEAMEAYVLDRMDPSDRIAFERQLEQDLELRKELDLQRENIRAVELGGFAHKLKEVVNAEKEVLQIHSTRRRRPLQYFAYAASVAVLIAVAIWFIARPSLNERLFTQFHHPDPGLPVAMSATDDHLFHDAMVAYKLGDHAEAREKWISLMELDPANDTLIYYIANTFLNDGRVVEAIPLFQQVADDASSTFRVKARWYLFLSYVYIGETDKAREVAPTTDAMYGERVQAVLLKLDQ